MRILVTGASGLLGGRLALLLAQGHDVVATRHRAPPPPGVPSLPLDLRSADSISDVLAAARPDAVVHSAACADADVCEREPETARVLNALATARLAAACLERRARLVAISTDLVLSGERPQSDETVAARPILEYGRSKLAAEQAVLAASREFAVVRVALVVGRGFGGRSTASEGVAWALGAARRVRLFGDQFRTPIDPESVAAAIALILEGRGAGLFHLGGPERLSRHALGLRAARALGLDAALIDAALQAREPIGFARPADCSLDSSLARRALGWEPRPLDSALRESRLSAG